MRGALAHRAEATLSEGLPLVVLALDETVRVPNEGVSPVDAEGRLAVLDASCVVLDLEQSAVVAAPERHRRAKDERDLAKAVASGEVPVEGVNFSAAARSLDVGAGSASRRVEADAFVVTTGPSAR